MGDGSNSGTHEFQPPPVEYRIVSPTNDFVRFEETEVEQSIPDRFEQQVRKYPNRLAVKTKDHEFTYDELNKAANRVAWAILKQRDKGQETIVLLLEHGAPTVVALLGVLKAGKIYVPLDPSFPRARLDYMLKDSEAALILTNNKNMAFARELANDTTQLINIDKLDADLSTENPGLSIPPEAFAYIAYTSGSTGEPKGVIENHLDVLHFTFIYTNSTHVSQDDRVLLVGSFCFSGSASYLYPALLNGAALLPFDIASEGIENLVGWLVDEEITLYGGVPSIFRGVVAILTGEEDLSKIRLVRLGGDKAYKKDVELCRRHFSPDCIFRVGLGGSEAKICRHFFIDKDLEIVGNSVPVGYPVANTEILLLDDHGNDVGFNQVGEIVVRGRYISPGYWRKPEQTAETFKPDPEGSDKRLYYTGDLGIMAPDGCLYHLGRKDFQVKIRGYRIEIGEIEGALLALDCVRETVVIPREDMFGEQRLVAYIVPATEYLPTVNELRRALSDSLPDYMIPSIFVTLDAIPKNTGGKVDRQALPAPGIGRPELDVPFAAPGTPVEVKLAKIWRDVLGLNEIGIHDNFFDLGGHSLLATRIMSRVMDTFHVKMPLSTLFQTPTVADMAIVIVQSQTGEVEREDVEHILAELEKLPDEEMKQLLADGEG
ncbi:amino acid adenylation domain-containing protein [Candidatus Poribacteria bacterium]